MYPKQVKAFLQWAKLMSEQALVPDRVQYKGLSTSSSRGTKRGGKKRMKMRTNRRRRRRKKQRED